MWEAREYDIWIHRNPSEMERFGSDIKEVLKWEEAEVRFDPHEQDQITLEDGQDVLRFFPFICTWSPEGEVSLALRQKLDRLPLFRFMWNGYRAPFWGTAEVESFAHRGDARSFRITPKRKAEQVLALRQRLDRISEMIGLPYSWDVEEEFWSPPPIIFGRPEATCYIRFSFYPHPVDTLWVKGCIFVEEAALLHSEEARVYLKQVRQVTEKMELMQRICDIQTLEFKT